MPERTISAFRLKLKLFDNIFECCFGNHQLPSNSLRKAFVWSAGFTTFEFSWEFQNFHFFLSWSCFSWIGGTLFESRERTLWRSVERYIMMVTFLSRARRNQKSHYYSKFASRVSFDNPNFGEMGCRIVVRYGVVYMGHSNNAVIRICQKVFVLCFWPLSGICSIGTQLTTDSFVLHFWPISGICNICWLSITLFTDFSQKCNTKLAYFGC